MEGCFVIELKIKTGELKQAKLFIGTPMFGGQCCGMFTRSVADLSALCTHYGIQLQLFFLFNESLITRARNYICDEFMRGEAGHLMFIDADIGFDAKDIIALMTLQIQNPPFDIIGGCYPKKCISWEKIVQAVNKGLADKDPNILDKFVGDFVFNPKAGTQTIPLGEPVEVLEIGTGFMMIRRATMEKFRDAFPQYNYRPDHARTVHFDGSREIMQYFQAEIDPKSKRYLSEDYWFSQRCQELNLGTYLCPWMKLQHMGAFVFGGSLMDLAAAGSTATVDTSLLKKKTA
jgi:hypothetical protein